MLLYMIRHGESEANFNRTHSGWSCVSLTEKGVRQAIAARKNVEGVEFDELYVSDVLRAQQTAENIFPNRERKFITFARELNNTPLHGLNKDEAYEKYGEIYLTCRENFDYGPMGIDCESLAHMSGRAKQLLDWAKDSGKERICVVSHAGFIVAMAGHVLGVEPHFRGLACDNASVNVFEYKNGFWRIKLWNLAPDVE